MPNEQTSVPLFASGEVLTAANMNISAGTGVPVFTNTTTRDAAFGGANEKVLAEGQLCYLSSTNVVQYYDGAAWATVGPASSALTLITPTSTANSGGSVVTTGGQVVGTGCASFSLNGVFTSTYDNYLIQINSASASSAGNFLFKLRAAGTDLSATYYWGLTYVTWAAASGAQGGSNTTSWKIGSFESPVNCNILVQNPYLSVAKGFTGGGQTLDAMQTLGGTNTSTASHDGFTLAGSAGNVTATVRVFGYQKS
jgi:hypothetical protein